jgi:NADH:ubiquinone oxidoreductase subunit 2 (subunit N)
MKNYNMKGESIIIMTGISMIIAGVVLFYSIQNNPDLDQLLRQVKHGGTFVGLMGIGVTVAGILLRLMEKEEVPIQEDFDV